jgi:hypothetical protein
VQVDTFQAIEEIEGGRRMMNYVIVEGKAWPFEQIFDTEEDFRGYFMSKDAFVVRSLQSDRAARILGCFYVKLNFPGRCFHLANGGFILKSTSRGNRVGTLMGACFNRYARDLAYKGSYFNSVFQSNEAAVRLREKLGFSCVAINPNAARLNVNGMPVDPKEEEAQLDTALG